MTEAVSILLLCVGHPVASLSDLLMAVSDRLHVMSNSLLTTKPTELGGQATGADGESQRGDSKRKEQNVPKFQ